MQSPTTAFVSVIIPCRNEERFIGRCLESVGASTFPKERLEVLVVDGMSDDGTRAIVRRRAEADPTVHLIDNPNRTAPCAMNLGIRHARGEIIVRMDAHCLYPADYIGKAIGWLCASGADNVGGVCRTRPANESAKARAIAAALAHPFGVGNSFYRIGTNEPRWVDTVPFGCYRREVFDRIGMFDEDLPRNQDEELNARLARRGGRILLVPEIVCQYFARESLAKLWRMYFQYGYFKPLVARKVGAVVTVRQLAPPFFVAALACTVVAGRLPIVQRCLAATLLAYAGADAACAARAGWREGLRSVLWLMAAFPVLHVAYGLGFWKGCADFVARGRPPRPRDFPASR